MIRKLMPASLKAWLEAQLPITAMKYTPYRRGVDSFVIPESPESDLERCDTGLPIPPRAFLFTRTKEHYLASGAEDVGTMLDVLGASGFSLERGRRVLDFGCGGGRMIRQLARFAGSCEIWGVDTSADHIYWCKENLDPPFHFATTTTIPHLPFEDRYFDLVFAMSVFTHIDDLAESWLLELRRILSEQGRLYFTILDHHSIELLETVNRDSPLAKRLSSLEVYRKSKGNFRMLVSGREHNSQVFYHRDHFCEKLASIFDVLSVTEEAMGFQTAILVKRARGRNGA